MTKGKRTKIDGFKYPSADNIKGRTSTICRSMACTLLAREGCSTEEETLWKSFFPDKKCAYCGKRASHLDHLYALISDRKPTGYCTEPANLVPCCRECNQPKGNMYWEDFMRSDKCHHTSGSGSRDELEIVKAKEKRIEVMRKFQIAMPANKVDISDEILDKWESILNEFDKKLDDAQNELEDLKKLLYHEI